MSKDQKTILGSVTDTVTGGLYEGVKGAVLGAAIGAATGAVVSELEAGALFERVEFDLQETVGTFAKGGTVIGGVTGFVNGIINNSSRADRDLQQENLRQQEEINQLKKSPIGKFTRDLLSTTKEPKNLGL